MFFNENKNMKQNTYGENVFVYFCSPRHAVKFSIVAMNKKRLVAECPYWRDRRHGGFLVICPLGPSCEFFHPEILDVSIPADVPILQFIEYTKPQLDSVKFYLFLADRSVLQQSANQTHAYKDGSANSDKENSMPPICLMRQEKKHFKRVKVTGTCPYWRDKHVQAYNLTVTCPIGESCEFFHPTPAMLGDHKAPTYDPLKKLF